MTLNEMLPIIIPIIGALLVATVTGLLSYRYGLKTQLEATRKDRRQLAYSQLLGHQAMLSQLVVSRFEAFANSDYNEYRWKLAGHPSDSLDLHEAQRWMRKAEDLAFEVAKCRKELFETLGLIRAVYKPQDVLTDKLSKVENFAMPSFRTRPFDGDETPEAWIAGVIPDLQAFVETEISVSMRDLASYLQRAIEQDAR